MYEHETLGLEELGEQEGFDFEEAASGELEPFDDLEDDGEAFESGGDLYSDYEAFAEASPENLEADPFISDLVRSATRTVARAASQGINTRFLKNLAKHGAQVAGGAIAGRQGARIAGRIADQVIRESSFEGYYENGGSYESALEGTVDMEALHELHYLADQVAEAESEQEADEFLAALAPVIGQVAGPLLSSLFDSEAEGHDLFDEEGLSEQERDEFLPALLPMAAPLLAKGVGALGKLFSKNKRTRRFNRVLPKVATTAATRLARQARQGRRPTPARIAATVGSTAARVLANPSSVSQAMQQNRTMARRIAARPPVGGRPRPSGMPIGHRPPAAGRGPYAGGRPRSSRIVGYIPVYARR